MQLQARRQPGKLGLNRVLGEVVEVVEVVVVEVVEVGDELGVLKNLSPTVLTVVAPYNI